MSYNLFSIFEKNFMNSCTKIWQSWDFMPTSFKSCTKTMLLIFEEYPSGTLTLFRHSQKFIFSLEMYHVGETTLTNLLWCQIFLYLLFNEIQMSIYPILCPSLNVKKCVNQVIIHIFLYMHYIYVVSNL